MILEEVRCPCITNRTFKNERPIPAFYTKLRSVFHDGLSYKVILFYNRYFKTAKLCS